MRFFRWYWRLTKEAFRAREERPGFANFLKDDALKLVAVLKWVLTTSFIASLGSVTLTVMWNSLPEAIQNLISDLALVTWNSVEVISVVVWNSLVVWVNWVVANSIVAWNSISSWGIAFWAFLDPIKPFFVWLFSFDPHHIFYLVLSFLLHLIILLFIAQLASILIVPIGYSLKKLVGAQRKIQHSIIGLMELVIGLFVGYLATTSSFSIALVGYCARFVAYH